MSDVVEATEGLINEWRRAQIEWARKRKALGKISEDNLIECVAVHCAAAILLKAFPLPDLTDEARAEIERLIENTSLRTGTLDDLPPPPSGAKA